MSRRPDLRGPASEWAVDGPPPEESPHQAFDGGLDAAREAAVRAAAADPDEGVREDAGKVLAGEPLEEPTLDLDEDG